MRLNKKQDVVIVCAVLATIFLFVMGRWYWYQSEALEIQRMVAEMGQSAVVEE